MTNGITTMLTIGIDLGDRRSEVCVLGIDGEVKRRFASRRRGRAWRRSSGTWCVRAW